MKHSTPADPCPARRLVELPGGPASEAAVGVVERLRAAGHQAFFVGGCVRDLLLGVEPKDWDVATSARPGQTRAVFSRVIDVGVAFGVMRVVVGRGAGRQELEVATFRSDGAYGDGRRPDEVRFTDAREDVMRRDFTINGLLASPRGRAAEVVDMVGGIADLESGVLRAIGEPRDRLREDGLRILRGVRFAARFDLRVEPRTRAALRSESEMLRSVSPERVLQELRGLLRSPHGPRAVAMLGALGLHGVLWPALGEADPGLRRAAHRLAALQACVAAPPVSAPGAFRPETRLDLPLGLAGLFDDVLPRSPRAQRAFFRSLRLPLVEGRRLQAIAALAGALRPLAGTPLPLDVAGVRLLRQEEADAALLLAIARARLGGRPAGGFEALRALRAATPRGAWCPEPWIRGATLKALGYAPGPRFKQAVRAAEDVQLAGGDRSQALAAARAALDAPGA